MCLIASLIAAGFDVELSVADRKSPHRLDPERRFGDDTQRAVTHPDGAHQVFLLW